MVQFFKYKQVFNILLYSITSSFHDLSSNFPYECSNIYGVNQNYSNVSFQRSFFLSLSTLQTTAGKKIQLGAILSLLFLLNS